MVFLLNYTSSPFCNAPDGNKWIKIIEILINLIDFNYFNDFTCLFSSEAPQKGWYYCVVNPLFQRTNARQRILRLQVLDRHVLSQVSLMNIICSSASAHASTIMFKVPPRIKMVVWRFRLAPFRDPSLLAAWPALSY